MPPRYSGEVSFSASSSGESGKVGPSPKVILRLALLDLFNGDTAKATEAYRAAMEYALLSQDEITSEPLFVDPDSTSTISLSDGRESGPVKFSDGTRNSKVSGQLFDSWEELERAEQDAIEAKREETNAMKASRYVVESLATGRESAKQYISDKWEEAIAINQKLKSVDVKQELAGLGFLLDINRSSIAGPMLDKLINIDVTMGVLRRRKVGAMAGLVAVPGAVFWNQVNNDVEVWQLNDGVSTSESQVLSAQEWERLVTSPFSSFLRNEVEQSDSEQDDSNGLTQDIEHNHTSTQEPEKISPTVIEEEQGEPAEESETENRNASEESLDSQEQETAEVEQPKTALEELGPRFELGVERTERLQAHGPILADMTSQIMMTDSFGAKIEGTDGRVVFKPEFSVPALTTAMIYLSGGHPMYEGEYGWYDGEGRLRFGVQDGVELHKQQGIFAMTGKVIFEEFDELGIDQDSYNELYEGTENDIHAQAALSAAISITAAAHNLNEFMVQNVMKDDGQQLLANASDNREVHVALTELTTQWMSQFTPDTDLIEAYRQTLLAMFDEDDVEFDATLLNYQNNPDNADYKETADLAHDLMTKIPQTKINSMLTRVIAEIERSA